MPNKMKAECDRDREHWITLPEAVAHICATNNCDERVARRKLVVVLAGEPRALGVLKWEREQGDQPPPFGSTSITMPTDTPPLGREWLKAKFRWKNGRVRDDWGEYKNGKWRVLLLPRRSVARRWQPNPPSEPTSHAGPASDNVVSIVSHSRGRRPQVSNRVKDSMRQDIQEKRFTKQELSGMSEEALAAQYEASRDTCRKARLAVLSESKIVEIASARILDK
jgi:hypothetical protein